MRHASPACSGATTAHLGFAASVSGQTRCTLPIRWDQLATEVEETELP